MKNKTVKRRPRKAVNRNYERNQAQHTFAVTTKGSIFIIIMIVLSISYFGILHHNESLAAQIKDAENLQEKLERERRIENGKWENMRSVGNIHRTLSAHGLSRQYIIPRNVIVMKDSALPKASGRQESAVAYSGSNSKTHL